MAQNETEDVGRVKLTRVILVEDMPEKDTLLLDYANRKIIAMSASTWITTPNPTILLVTGLVGTYTTSQAKTKFRTTGLVSIRDVDKLAVKSALHCWAAQVQYTADQNVANAIVIIEAYDYKVRHVHVGYKSPFAAKLGKTSGTVILITKAPAKKAYYERQMSSDGHTWTDLEGTMYCKLVVSGLTPGSSYYFRCRTTTNKGKSDWSQVVMLIVV